MWKHITLQSICEITILLILYINTPKFIHEYKKDLRDFVNDLSKCIELPGNNPKFDNILYGNKEKRSEKRNFLL